MAGVDSKSTKSPSSWADVEVKQDQEQPKRFQLLYLGDVVGRPGRTAIKSNVRALRQGLELDMVLANGENAAAGFGLTVKTAAELFSAGVDGLSSGNHIRKHKEIYNYLNKESRLVRPGNYPEGAPGKGWTVITARSGTKVALINLMGRTYMSDLDCPFRAADKILEEIPEDVKIRIVDFHAEATSEKKAMGYYLDGRVSAVFGTHTHVQTNDAQILPQKTGYMTDLGMCGVEQSILGVEPKIIIERTLSKLPNRFTLAKGEARLRGALLDVDPATGAAVSVTAW